MRNLSTSVIVAAFIIIGIIPGLFAILISTSEKYEENLSFHFEEPMDKCDNLENEMLNLFDTGLKVVGPNFVVSDVVDSINLENNIIVDVSSHAFKAVPNLSCLNIRRNKIQTIFLTFLGSFNQTLLTKLNLAQATFKKSFGDDESLIMTTYNAKTGGSSNIFLPNLTHLDISDNSLFEFPHYFKSSFPRLTHLYLSDNGFTFEYLDRIPETTQYLYLERNHGFIDLSYFPKNITALYLNENHFLINDSYSNQFPNLRILSLRKCNHAILIIRSLDKGKIVDLDISFNNILVIREDEFKNFKSLQRLSLDRNSLSSLLFLANISSLTDLSVACNKLAYISSDTFANLKNLKRLNLRGNNIMFIDEDAFLNLSELEKLDLAENRLFNLTSSWMTYLTSLRYLNLKSNQFSSIESMSIHAHSNLNHLFFGNNSFTLIEMKDLQHLPDNVVAHLSSANNSICIT